MKAHAEILSQEIEIDVRGGTIKGLLSVPGQSKSMVIFAHGSGSGRLSPRNRYVADRLNQENLATLLIDLLTEDEESMDMMAGLFRFNIDHLAGRLTDVTKWAAETAARDLEIGYFGASTGAAAALKASIESPKEIKAVVSRGGRPDMAEDILEWVKAPTLLIVGSEDSEVIEMNRFAFERLQTEKKMVIVPGATHLFEEPGKLEEVADHAKEWFLKYMAK